MNTNEIKKATKFELDITKLRYENECQRQESIINQAGNMQSSFSFTTAALFMACPVMFDNKGVLSFWFIFGSIASIAFVLLISLFAATMAQNRSGLKVFPDGKEVLNYIEKNEIFFDCEEKRNKYLAYTYAEIQESLTFSNNKRIWWLKLSMWAFYFALLISVVWFALAMMIIFM